MSLKNRVAALEERLKGNEPPVPILVIAPGEDELEARQRYEAQHGHAPRDIIHIHLVALSHGTLVGH